MLLIAAVSHQHAAHRCRNLMEFAMSKMSASDKKHCNSDCAVRGLLIKPAEDCCRSQLPFKNEQQVSWSGSSLRGAWKICTAQQQVEYKERPKEACIAIQAKDSLVPTPTPALGRCSATPTLCEVHLELLQVMLRQPLCPVLLLTLQQPLLGHQPFPVCFDKTNFTNPQQESAAAPPCHTAKSPCASHTGYSDRSQPNLQLGGSPIVCSHGPLVLSALLCNTSAATPRLSLDSSSEKHQPKLCLKPRKMLWQPWTYPCGQKALTN